MIEVMIPILTFVAIVALGGAAVSARAVRRQLVAQRIARLGQEAVTIQMGEPPNLIARLLMRIGTAVSSKTPSMSLRERLSRAGYHSENAPAIFLGSKIVLMLIGVVVLGVGLLQVTSLMLPLRLMAILWGSGALFAVPNMVVAVHRSKRRGVIRNHLPDAIDLLEICVSAGMGLDMAWNAVAEEIRAVCPTLADEMALANLEIHLGAPRATAMRHMADRTGADDIASLVSVLVQSERFGTSIADALKAFADSMRELRSQRAEEEAEKMPVKLLFPLVLCLFPAVLIVIAGPAALEWVRIIGAG